jgi:hypothetical protein
VTAEGLNSSKPGPNLSKPNQILQSPPKEIQEKNSWIFLDFLGGIEPFQRLAPTPWRFFYCDLAGEAVDPADEPPRRSLNHANLASKSRTERLGFGETEPL